MPRTKLLSERNQKIYKQYRKIYDEQGLRHARILALLSKDFYLTEKTIEGIVLQESKKQKPYGKQP